jgi:cytidine deaminase
VSTDAINRAVALATEARERSYAPYTGFLMGTGIVGEDGREVRGALVENVSLGLAMCSERVALFTAVVEEVTPRVLAVCSERTGDDLTFPCGACLQVALEIAGPDVIIVAVDTDGVRGETTLQDVLPRGPHRFSPSRLEQ